MLKHRCLLILAAVLSASCVQSLAEHDGHMDILEDKNNAVPRVVHITTNRIISLYPGLTSVQVRNEPSVFTNPNPTANTPLPSTTSLSKIFATKTALKNCHVQGTPSPMLSANIWGSSYAPDALACQLQCMFVSRCESYSFQTPASSNTKNCIKYLTLIDGVSKVRPSSNSGLFYSDKYPSDGSNFCYGNAPL